MSQTGWRPSSSIATAVRRAKMLDDARRFFAARTVLEVETPSLSRTTVSDPHIESMQATLGREPVTSYFLQTSPEYFMKRLLCAGFPDIYQISRVFRDHEAGRRHSPEFTLIEWYRRGYRLRQIMQETADFIATLIEPRFLPSAAEFIEYRKAFRTFAGVDPLESPVAALAEAASADQNLSDSLGEERDAWLDLVLSLRVLPRFGRDRLTVLYHYPASQAALARVCPENATVADRFEIFCGELELANGFVELQDADEQLRRFEADRATRRRREQPVHPIDKRLLGALAAGLPDCAGVAVGFDRLLMINEMAEDIRFVQTFAFDEDRQ